MNPDQQDTALATPSTVNVMVLIPSGFLRFTGQVKSVQVSAATVGDALRALSLAFPLLRAQMFSGDQQLRRFINVFLNARDIRFLQQENTRLQSQDVITILPAIAGG